MHYTHTHTHTYLCKYSNWVVNNGALGNPCSVGIAQLVEHETLNLLFFLLVEEVMLAHRSFPWSPHTIHPINLFWASLLLQSRLGAGARGGES